MSLKRKAIKWISHNYEYCMNNCEIGENLFEAINLLKMQLESKDEQIAIFNKLIYLLKKTSYSFQSINLSKNGSCIVMKSSSAHLHYIATDFYIYKGTKTSVLPDGRMFIRHEEKYLFITDIQVEINQGMGTLLMKELFEYARLNNVGVIVGNLEQRDLADHGERLLHFYCKFKFVITDLDGGRKHIELKL